jgi:hypothetical protein
MMTIFIKKQEKPATRVVNSTEFNKIGQKKIFGNNQTKQMSHRYYTKKKREKKKIVGNSLPLHCEHCTSQKNIC